MSVNPDDMDMTGAPTEYVDLEHQVIRQKVDVPDTAGAVSIDLLPGDEGAEFDPGERQLDREEIAQLVYYRRFASINFLQAGKISQTKGQDYFAIVDASVGINGDLFRPVTTQTSVTTNPDNLTMLVDTGGEIGLLDNYTLFAQPKEASEQTSGSNGAVAQFSEFDIDYYDWPTGGPIVDSFDSITCGMGFGVSDTDAEVQLELRYDFYWDVREQGRSTNPFGRPSTR
jgi:hypothetical protein